MPGPPSASDRALGTSAEYSSIENPGGSLSASSRGMPWLVRAPMSSRTAGPVVADGRSGLSAVADARSCGGAGVGAAGGAAGSGGAAGGSTGRAAGASAWTGAGAGLRGSAQPAASANPARIETGRARRRDGDMAGRLTQVGNERCGPRAVSGARQVQAIARVPRIELARRIGEPGVEVEPVHP